VLEVELVVVVAFGSACPPAVAGLQSMARTTATPATPRAQHPTLSLPTSRDVDNAFL
jgi:hypothetical protein